MMKNPYQSPQAMWLAYRTVDPMADEENILTTSTQGETGGESGIFPIGGGG